jgi:Fe-S cluster assembly protein SufD
MIQEVLNNLIDVNDEYLIVSNSEIISHSKNISSFLIDRDINLRVIYLLDKDAKVNFRILKNLDVKLTEMFYKVADNVDFEVSYEIDESSRFNYLSLRKTTDISNFKVITNISLAKAAYISIKELAVYENPANSYTNIYLNGVGTKAEVKNVYINASSKSQDFKINTYHIVGNTNSDIKVYGISKNNSLLTVDTKGIIKALASGANLSQKTKGLILDEYSNISANPILEIDHFDCLAAHGASIGAIDDEELYYLMSRGLTREDAEKLIVNGFIVPFFDEIEEEKLKSQIELLIRPFV